MKVPISKSIFTEEDISHVIQPLSDGWVVPPLTSGRAGEEAPARRSTGR